MCRQLLIICVQERVCGLTLAPPTPPATVCPAKDSLMLVNRAWFTVILRQLHVRVGVCHGITGWGIFR